MDESERLVAPSLSTLAFERLENAIMQGEIKPGERLSESGLASRFGISRGPLREAIGQLEGRRLVERKYNLGARVVSLSNSDLIDLLVIRESLEGMACRMAAARLSTAQLGQLENMLVGHAKSEEVQSGRGYFQGRDDADFHQVILRECGNPRFRPVGYRTLFPFAALPPSGIDAPRSTSRRPSGAPRNRQGA